MFHTFPFLISILLCPLIPQSHSYSRSSYCALLEHLWSHKQSAFCPSFLTKHFISHLPVLKLDFLIRHHILLWLHRRRQHQLTSPDLYISLWLSQYCLPLWGFPSLAISSSSLGNIMAPILLHFSTPRSDVILSNINVHKNYTYLDLFSWSSHWQGPTYSVLSQKPWTLNRHLQELMKASCFGTITFAPASSLS